MRTHRRVPAGTTSFFRPVAAATCAALLSSAALGQQSTPAPPAAPATPVLLPTAPFTSPLEAQGGMTVRNSFYQYLAARLENQNEGRTVIESYGPFNSLENDVDLGYDLFENFINQLIESTGAELWTIFPGLQTGNIYVAILDALITVTCGSTKWKVDLDLDNGKTKGSFTVGDISYSTATNQHIFDVRAENVGMLYKTKLKLKIGNSCTLLEWDFVSHIAFEDVDYRVVVDLSTPTPTVSTQRVSSPAVTDVRLVLGDLPIGLGSSIFTGAILEYLAVATIFYPDLDTFSETVVPTQLSEATFDFWTRYVPGDQSILSLDPGHQRASYQQNLVAGTIDSPLYLTLGTNAGGSAVHSTFLQRHSGIRPNPQANGAGGSVNPSTVGPDFNNETTAADGTYYINESSLRHVVLGSMRSAVGRRVDGKDGRTEPLRVEAPFGRLAPEHGFLDVDYLLTDPASTILPIPLTSTQVNDLVTGFGGLGSTQMNGLMLEIEVREIDKLYSLPAVGTIGGEVLHVVQLDAIVTRGNDVLMTETYDAEFITYLHLTHDRKRNRNVMNGTQTYMTLLENGAGVTFDQMGPATSVAEAPVSSLLRALFGDRFASSDNRAQYLIEGLAAPLVGRGVQNLVRFPGLDLPALDRSYGSPSSTYDDAFDVGLVFNVPEQCASIFSWGARDGAQAQSTDDRMVVIDVQWLPQSAPHGHVDMTTSVLANSFPDDPANPTPSISDRGFIRMDYAAMSPGDESRVIHGTGFKTTPYLPSVGKHYATATAAGYEFLREILSVQGDRRATIELIPYTGVDYGPRVSQVIIDESPVTLDVHHDGTDYMVWAFNSRQSCVGLGTCDGERIGAYWKAPLDPALGLTQRSDGFRIRLQAARYGPDRYDPFPEVCSTSAGGNGGAGGTGQFD